MAALITIFILIPATIVSSIGVFLIPTTIYSSDGVLGNLPEYVLESASFWSNATSIKIYSSLVESLPKECSKLAAEVGILSENFYTCMLVPVHCSNLPITSKVAFLPDGKVAVLEEISETDVLAGLSKTRISIQECDTDPRFKISIENRGALPIAAFVDFRDIWSPVAEAAFRCKGGKTIRASFYVDSVDLKLSDGRALKLPQAISSGARYANADGSFVFSNNGNTAFITEAADVQEPYSDCAYEKFREAGYIYERHPRREGVSTESSD